MRFPRFLTSILSLAVFASISLVQADGGTPSLKPPKITTVMKKAAYGFPSVQAQQKAIEASEDQEMAVLLNQLSLTGSYSYNKTVGSLSLGDLAQEVNKKTTTQMVGAQLILSLTTWFQARGIAITRETQESALKAFQMQLATDAAQVYVNFYNSDSRYIYLQVLREKLGLIKKKVDSGTLQLNDANRGLLIGKLNELEATIGSVDLQRETAAVDLEKYTGEQPISYLDEWKKLPDEQRYQLGYGGIDWSKIDLVFPVPATAEEAFKRALTSPALIQRGLDEKSARNQWYLALSSMGPQLLFRFDKMRNSNSGDVAMPDFSVDGDVYTVNVNFNLGAGTLSGLNGARLLEEAAQLNRRATELDIKSNLVKMYASMKYTRSQVNSYDELLKAVIQGIEKTEVTNDQSFTDYLGLVTNLDVAATQINQLVSGLILIRVQTHGMMGTLLSEIETMDHIED